MAIIVKNGNKDVPVEREAVSRGDVVQKTTPKLVDDINKNEEVKETNTSKALKFHQKRSKYFDDLTS